MKAKKGKLTEQRTMINFRDDPKVLEELSFWSNKLGISREQLLRNMVQNGLDDLRISESVGLASLVGFIRKKIERGNHITQIIPSLG